jgi:hypothetical protein
VFAMLALRGSCRIRSGRRCCGSGLGSEVGVRSVKRNDARVRGRRRGRDGMGTEDGGAAF